MHSVVVLIRMEIGLSRVQLASLADVSVALVAGGESGEIALTNDEMHQMLAVVGRRFDRAGELLDVVDMSAVAACRSVLDPTFDPLDKPPSDKWLRSWARAGFLAGDHQTLDPYGLIRLAAANARLNARPNSQHVAPVPPTLAANRLATAGIGYAITGSAAANRIKVTGSEPWTVIYVDDLSAATELFGPPIDRSNPKLTLIESCPITRAGVWTDNDGVRVADPIQVLIDLSAGSDRMPEQAEALITERYLLHAHPHGHPTTEPTESR